MPSSADLEALFAGVYVFRLPIAVALSAATVVLLSLAVRGRWDRSAARHPASTGAVLLILLLVGLPLGWYLASPLFTSSELVEAAPAAIASPIQAAVSSAGSGPARTDPPPSPDASATYGGPTSSPNAPDASVVAESSLALATEIRGSFRGTDDFHFGRGTARLIVAADGSATLRFEDLAVRNGPDLYVYLSPDRSRYAKAAVEIGRLKADRGSFNYRIPPGTDLARVKSAVIWCKQFSFQFAVAPLR